MDFVRPARRGTKTFEFETPALKACCYLPFLQDSVTNVPNLNKVQTSSSSDCDVIYGGPSQQEMTLCSIKHFDRDVIKFDFKTLFFSHLRHESSGQFHHLFIRIFCANIFMLIISFLAKDLKQAWAMSGPRAITYGLQNTLMCPSKIYLSF